MEHLDISNIALAKALNIDPSLISRWLTGKRQIKLSSEALNKVSDYLMDKIQSMNYSDWLKRQMELDGLVFDYASSGDLLKGLKIWLASDGHDVSKTVDIIYSTGTSAAADSENRVKTGFVEISVFLNEVLALLPDNSKIDIHMSNEDAGLLLHESISRILFDSILEKRFQVRLILSLTSNTMAMSHLLSHYLQAIVEGLLTISVAHSMTQAITHQSTFVFGDELVFIVNETPKNIAPPIGMTVHEESFIEEAKKSFERAFNFSQVLFRRYNDDYSRNILEILHQEYGAPGNLDVIKDNINPLCMSLEAYDRALKSFGHKGEQFKWRSAEFERFKIGMNDNLNTDTVFREMLSLKRLRQIAEEGTCKMPALYFMNAGITYLDAPGCLAIIEGYIEYLKGVPNFHVVILDDMPIINENCCWHLKQNREITLNGWIDEEHIILHSNQLMLTHEFQMIYNEMWNRENYSEGQRKKSINVLQDIAKQLKQNHDLP